MKLPLLQLRLLARDFRVVTAREDDLQSGLFLEQIFGELLPAAALRHDQVRDQPLDLGLGPGPGAEHDTIRRKSTAMNPPPGKPCPSER
jgi:hypothetical protein